MQPSLRGSQDENETMSLRNGDRIIKGKRKQGMFLQINPNLRSLPKDPRGLLELLVDMLSLVNK